MPILNTVSNTYKYSNKLIQYAYNVYANLAIDISNSTLINGSTAQFVDTSGVGVWNIYEGTTSNVSVTSGSLSSEWTGGTSMKCVLPNISDYFWRYTFDTGTYSGSTIYDVNGQNAATIVGSNTIDTTAANASPATGVGILNMVSNTSPVNYVQLPSFRPDMTYGTTFAFWLYMNNTTDSWSFAMSFGLDYTGSGKGVVRFGTDGTNLNLAVYDSFGNLTSNKTTTKVTNTWVHYIWVLTPIGTWYLYANGKLLTTFTGVIYLTDQLYAANSLGRTNWASTPSFGGRLDDFRVYKRALSSVEAFMLYKSSAYCLRYNFELIDVSGTEVKNNYLNSYDGTLSNCSVVVDSGSQVSGQGYLSLSNTTSQYYKFYPIYFTTSGFTFSLWFRSNNSATAAARVFDIRGGSGFSGEISLTIQSATSLRFFINYTGSPDFTYTGLTNVNNNTWNHVAITFTYGGGGTTAQCLFYYNGVFVNQNTALRIYPPPGVKSTYNIGNYSDGASAGGERLNGGVDDFRFYPYPCQASEIYSIYKSSYKENLIGRQISTASGNSLPLWSTIPGINQLFLSAASYTVKPNEITLSPGTNNTYCTWTSPKTSTYAIDVSFANYANRSDGVGFQIFAINSNNTFKQLLYSRTVTTSTLLDTNNNYLSIPRYIVPLNNGDKIVLRSDLVANSISDSSVLSAIIYERYALP